MVFEHFLSDITTVEARLWFGVGYVSFFDPDDVEDEEEEKEQLEESPHVGDTSSDCSYTPSDNSAFLVTLRFGGDALPGQPQSLLSTYDGWMAMHLEMLEETTLYPVPTAWDVVEALLGHLTSRGGMRSCNRVVTRGPGAGSMPLRNPPQLLDLSFTLKKGNLVLDLTARPRRWARRSRKSSILVINKNLKAPVQKVRASYHKLSPLSFSL